MSRSVDLFIDAPASPDEVAEAVARLAAEMPGSSVTPGDQPGTWELRHGDTVAVLAEHPYVDDGDLLLRRYRYALSARVDSGTRLADSPATALLRRVGQHLSQATSWPVLLVLDLQFSERPARVTKSEEARSGDGDGDGDGDGAAAGAPRETRR